MKEVIERCKWLVNKCEDKAITPDVKDDVSYLLEEIERLNNIIKEVREQINKDREKKNYEKDGLMKQAFYCNKTDKLLKILDKGE